MATYSLTINGIERDARLESVRVQKRVNQHDTLDAEILWEAGSPTYRTELDGLVVLVEDGVTLFAGFITSIDELEEGGPNTGMFVSRITACSYAIITQWRHVTMSVVGGSPGTTLKQFLTALIAAGDWDTEGMTLHPSQDDGPILAPMPFVDTRGNDILSRLAQDYGRVWRVDELNRLRMWTPGDIAAPFDIDEDDLPAKWFGDVPTYRTWHDAYANRVIVVGNTRTVLDHQEVFTSTGVETVFTGDFTIAGVRHGVVAVTNLPDILPGDRRYEPLGPTGSGYDWEYDLEANTFTRTLGTLASGAVITVTFDGEKAARGQADDAGEQGSPPRVRDVIIRTPVETDADAQARAEDILPNRVRAKDTRARYFSDELANLLPGQTQTITAPTRNLSGDFQLTQVTIRYDANRPNLIREVETNQGYVQQGTIFDYYASAASPGSVTGTDAGTGGNHSGGGTESGGSVSSNDSQTPGGTSGTALAVPGNDTEVFFNQKGGLGARPGLRWLYEIAANFALGTPGAAAVANQGAGAYAATAREYRIQWVTIAGTVYTAASEFGPAASFTPSGSGSAARVTRPTPGGATTPTHWEIYAREIGDPDFWYLAELPLATTFYDDTTAPADYEDSAFPAGPDGAYNASAQLLITSLLDAQNQPFRIKSGDLSQGFFAKSNELGLVFNMNIENGNHIATHETCFRLAFHHDDKAIFAQVFFDQTPGAAVDFTKLVSYGFGATTGTFLGFAAGGDGVTGHNLGATMPGYGLLATRNLDGSRAAGNLTLQDKDGGLHAVWVDAAGKLRLGGAAPTANGSVSDTSGVVVGTQT